MSLLRKFPNKSLFFTTRFLTTTQNPNPNSTFPDTPTSAYYDKLINAAARDGDLETIRHLLNKRTRDDCFNTSNTFQFITNTDASLSLLNDLTKTLSRLDEGFPRRHAYDTLIARLCKIKRVDEALRVVDTMARGEHGLSACSFHPIISLLTREKKLDKAWRVVEFMKEVKVSPDLTVYNYFLTSYCFNRDLTGASEVLKKMEEEGLGYDGRTYDALVLGACRAGKVDGALVVLRRMVDDGQSFYYSTYSHVIGALLKLGYYDQAVRFVMVCGGRDVKLDTECFGNLASKLIKMERFDEVKVVLKEMTKRGLVMGHVLRDFYEVNVGSEKVTSSLCS